MALPASGQEPQVDHVWLSLGPVGLGDGWKLTAAVTSPDFDPISGDEIVGVTLERARSDRARESHALRAHLEDTTISFDGRDGRWRFAGRVGTSLAVDMTMAATGEPEEVAADEGLPFACKGAFVRVPVALTGTFAVRTRTRRFGTIRRERLTGVVTYNRGGPVECGVSAPPRCEPGAFLSVSGWTQSGPRSLSVDRGRRSLVVQFAETPTGPGPAATWYHVMSLSRVNALVGELPTIDVRLPRTVSVSGSATFAAWKTSESTQAGCRTRTTEGAFTGSLRVRFSAWGARTFGDAPIRGRLTAFYRVSAPA